MQMEQLILAGVKISPLQITHKRKCLCVCAIRDYFCT